MSVEICVKMEEIPSSCSVCQFYSETPYRCHNERGLEAACALGYLKGDMREVSFRTGHLKGTKHENCQLEFNIIKSWM